jgi:Methyltransferase domain
VSRFRFVRRRTRSAARRLSGFAVERRHGVSTGGRVYLEDLGMDEEHRLWYAPSDWLAVRRALKQLDPTPEDVLVDYGCGAGRVVMTAAGFPFKQVIGLELTPELTARARSNLERNRGTIRAGSVEIVTADATSWAVPPDLTVAYFFCPFIGPPFATVIERLIASVDEHPRPLRIVYNLPVEHSFLIRTGRMRVLDASPNLWLSRSRRGPMTIVTYLILPHDDALRADYVARFPQRMEGAEVWLGEYEPGYILDKPERLGGRYLDRPRLVADDAR